MITDLHFYLCAIPAVLLFGMAKGGFGGGISVLSVPIMAIAVSPIQAATILLPLLVIMDMVALWSFRGSWHHQNLKIILPGAILGIIVGALGFRYLSEDAIRILIGSIALIFCGNYFLARGPQTASQPNILKGSFWGVVAGFTSFGIHAGGPPLSVYLLPQQMEKRLLMGTFAVTFAVINAIKLIPYALLGQFDHSNLATSLVLLPIAPLGVWLGFWLLNRTNEVIIYKLCYLFLGVVGIKLLLDGLQINLNSFS